MIFLLESYRRCGDLFGDRPSACHPLVGFTTFLEDVERVDVRLKPDTGELLLTVKNHRTHSRSDVDDWHETRVGHCWSGLEKAAKE